MKKGIEYGVPNQLGNVLKLSLKKIASNKKIGTIKTGIWSEIAPTNREIKNIFLL
jgi:hypothetical protein